MRKFTVFLLVNKLYINNTRGIQKVTPIYFMVLKSWTFEKITEHYCSIAENAVNFQCSIHICWQSSSTLEHIFPSSTSCSPSFVATGVWYSAMPHCQCLNYQSLIPNRDLNQGRVRRMWLSLSWFWSHRTFPILCIAIKTLRFGDRFSPWLQASFQKTVTTWWLFTLQLKPD